MNTMKVPVFPGSLLADNSVEEREKASKESLKLSLVIRKGSYPDKSMNTSFGRSPLHMVQHSSRHHLGSKKRSAVAALHVKSPQLDLPSAEKTMNKSIGQSSRSAGRKKPSFGKMAGASQKNDEDSDEAFDLMKYFFDWNDYFNKQLSLQQFALGKKRSADILALR